MSTDKIEGGADTVPEAMTNDSGIVSVNSRGGSGKSWLPKIVFGLLVFSLLLIAGLVSINKWRATKKAEAAVAEQATKAENKAATVGIRRTFEADPPPLASAAGNANKQSNGCADGSAGTPLISNDGKPMMSAAGVPMRICKDGRVAVPALDGAGADAAPIPLSGKSKGTTGGGATAPSRYGGDISVGSSAAGGVRGAIASMGSGVSGARGAAGNTSESRTSDLQGRRDQALGMIQEAMRGQSPSASGMSGGSRGGGDAGSIGGMLTPSDTPLVQAGMLGDRNMILPKGRTIDCALTVRIINEVAGMTTCVLTGNVYSDNGNVLLLERGSEAVGEYKAAMAQGQRRLFVLWTRVKTPAGVVINLNSPAADALGTSGLDGYVDNHWWDRIGAAFLLSMVKDVIGYEVAKVSGGSGMGGYAYQNTTQTGDKMVEKILDSTINIKPTLYKNQGDRATIFVARDLDFSSVYVLRPR